MDSAQIGEWIRFLLPLVSIFVIFWLLIIRPQRREQKMKQEMLSSLKKGDEILTIGGIFGKVKHVKLQEKNSKEDSVVTLDIADGVHMKVLLNSIDRVIKSVTEKESSKEKGEKE